MDIARMKVVGAVLGMMAFGGVLGALFTGYGGFANASISGYANTQAAVTMGSGSDDGATQANSNKSNSDSDSDTSLPSKEDIRHYAELFAQNFASQLGVDSDTLNNALRGAFQATIDQAVADGKLDADGANAVKSKVGSTTFSDLVSIPLGMAGAGEVDMSEALGNSQAFIDATGTAFDAGGQLLGITGHEFEQDLQNGTLLSAAQSHNVTVETLKNTVVSTLRTELDKAVASGQLTQDQADLAYNAFSGKFEMALTGVLPTNRPADK